MISDNTRYPYKESQTIYMYAYYDEMVNLFFMTINSTNGQYMTFLISCSIMDLD